VLRRVEDGMNRRAQHLDELVFRAQAALNRKLRSHSNRLKSAEARLARQNPAVRLQTDRRRLELLHTRIERASQFALAQRQRRTEAAATRLGALSPLRVLDRGYALVYGPTGHLLLNAEDAANGQAITARLAKGSVQAQVLSVSVPETKIAG
jgi:exodeoxyribonuclease VII large subunit